MDFQNSVNALTGFGMSRVKKIANFLSGSYHAYPRCREIVRDLFNQDWRINFLGKSSWSVQQIAREILASGAHRFLLERFTIQELIEFSFNDEGDNDRVDSYGLIEKYGKQVFRFVLCQMVGYDFHVESNRENTTRRCIRRLLLIGVGPNVSNHDIDQIIQTEKDRRCRFISRIHGKEIDTDYAKRLASSFSCFNDTFHSKEIRTLFWYHFYNSVMKKREMFDFPLITYYHYVNLFYTEDEYCAFCLDNLDGKTLHLSFKDCRHSFHLPCLCEYFISNRDYETIPCPLCKKEIKGFLKMETVDPISKSY